MKVMVIVKASRSSEAGEMPSERMLTEMGKFNEELVKAGVMLSGDGLHPSSRGARVRFSGANRTVVDGPFAETKELIAGFWIWRVKSLEEAIEWVKRCPNPMPEESEIEIRQVFDAEDFGAEFTPELREQEAVLRAQTLGLNEPRFENGPALRIAGPQQSYTPQTRQGIPAQWTKFAPHIGTLAGQVGSSAYGVCLNATKDGNFDYLTGVEVSAAAKLPADFQQAELPAQRYIVFTHTQHVSLLPQTIDAIWTKWAPDCGLRLADGACFERYTAEFNPQTGLGGMELWVPLQA
ncbi:MAG TPA: GyrI-like domain-containing protein [Pirellulaceae bacterium]|nr:GyrI-like domain-containing protein [Pirellulaceae bacterium]